MTQSFKIGDVVMCVSIGNACYLTAGRFYNVDGVRSGGYIEVVNNNGELFPYSRDRFKLFDPNYPNPPHKHKDLIIAWANGAEIEVMGTTGSWCVVEDPAWRGIGKYRIKPTKSAKDVQIEELEAKAKELLDKITELKGSNG